MLQNSACASDGLWHVGPGRTAETAWESPVRGERKHPDPSPPKGSIPQPGKGTWSRHSSESSLPPWEKREMRKMKVRKV